MADFVPNFKVKYKETVAPELMKEFNYKTVMQIPVLEKITVSVGVGEATTNKKLLDAAVKELEQITGQHVVKTARARRSALWSLSAATICGTSSRD